MKNTPGIILLIIIVVIILCISVYISEMSYYVHYLHFSDCCPHLCCHVYHNVSAFVHSGLLQVVKMLNSVDCSSSTSYVLMDASYQLSPVNFSSESSPLPSPGIELTLFGYVTGSNQRLYLLYHVFFWTVYPV